jgi:CDP-glycerol glycerophosphotransferase (TagB/SpsB family)
MKQLYNKTIYIAPYSPMSNALKEYLIKQFNINFIGFIDNNNKNAYTIKNISKTYDFIIIFSQNHYYDIFEQYINTVPKTKLLVIDLINNKYQIKTNIIKDNKYSDIKIYSLKYPNKNGITFISKGFIDTNNKYLFLYCFIHKYNVTIITDNLKQIEELQNYNLPVIQLNTSKANKHIAQSKYLIFDQAYKLDFFIHKNQITIQLWHGIGLKTLPKISHIKYDYFISTSTWTNDTNFNNIFIAKYYLNCGYPRNDFLLQKKDLPLHLIFCDKDIYNIVKKDKIILYMPTFREYLLNNSNSLYNIIPFNYEEFNKSLKNISMKLIIKLHPSILSFFKDIKNRKFSNIIFHPAQGDIYPILKYTDILITDYSSVAYDFLLLDRPIIFFDYDRDIYEENMGGFLFDYNEFTPGIKVQTQNDLIGALVMEDKYKQERKEIKELFFDDTYKDSCKNIMDIIKV